MLIQLIVPGEYPRVEDLNTSLEAVLSRHGVARGARDDVRLIVEELACNAIEHGTPAAAATPRELSVDIAIEEDLLMLRFRDDGAPFNPLATPDPTLHDDADDRAIGGLGLYLIRQIAEEISYRRDDGCNFLQVTLRIPSPEEHP